MYKFLLLLVNLCLINCDSLIQFQNVERVIDLTSQLVKISVTITLENIGTNQETEFLLSPGNEFVGNLSYISIKNSKKEEIRKGASKVHKNFFIGLQPLAPGQTTVVYLEAAITRGLVPYPSNIQQKDKQLVRYYGNHYFFSAYPVAKQSTTVILNSRTVESYTKLKPVAQTDSSILYGPYLNVGPFADDPMVIHYENNSPFLAVTRLERIIEISHWGNIAVEENVNLGHIGAKLKGQFSRYDYQRDTGSSHPSIKSYRTILPAAAHDIYYRDSNGNISTSQVRHRKDYIELELRPRFPLFGGWNSSYTLGYSVPSYQYLFRKSSSEYVLNMRILDHVFDDMFVEELETKVILPVGASDIQVSTPYEVKRLPDEKTYKYLDRFGRTVVNLKKTNLVEQHIQDLEITYRWSSIYLLYEPAMLAAGLFAILILLIIYVRVDFSIYKPEHSKKD